MRRTATLIFSALAILAWGSISGAGTFISLGAHQEGAPTGEAVEIQVTEAPGEVILLEYDLAGFELHPVTIDGATYQEVRLGSESRLLEAGVPELPNICRSVIISDGAQMEVRVVSASYQDFTGIDVVSSKGNLLRSVDPSTVPYTFGDIYEADAWYPSEAASQREPYIMRDYRGMVVVVNPFQYNPVLHTLRVYDHLVIEVVPVGAGSVNVIDRAGPPTSVNGEFLKIYADHFLNFSGDRYNPIPEVGEMLIIAYDSFAPNMQPFVDWKNQMGIKTTLVPKSDVGTSSTEFESYIQQYYDTHDLAFVLLVGDASQIPSPWSGGGPADPVYALLEGTDSYPEIFIGRLSAEIAGQVDLQVQKSIEYESQPAANGHWYRRGVGIGSGEGAGIGDDGEADWQHIENIRLDLLDFTYTGVDSIYAHYPWQANATMVMNAVNDGRSLINYCGHGWMQGWSTTGFSNNHVSQLVNYDMLPWIVSVACVNGAFHSGTCFAEAWVRAEQGGQPTGAVAVYASTINMSWAPPMAAQDETVDLLWQEEKRTLGALCFSGSCQMMDEYGYSGQSEFKNWTIFGDPSLRVRSATPTDLTVEHDESIEPEAVSFTVTVPGVTDALCGLSYAGEYLGSEFTDGSGVAEIEIVGTLPDEAITLTVSYFNKMPYFAEIEVGQQLIPEIIVDPTEFVFDMPLDDTQVQYMTITNTGMEGSLLTYNVQVMPSMPGMWLAISPRSGDCEFDESDVIDVTVSTHGLHIGIYEANILVSSNAAPVVVVPVTLYSGGYSGIADRGKPATLSLQAVGPNPFGVSTRIAFGLPQSSSVELGVYDMSGRLVRTLLSGSMDAGYHNVSWDGRGDVEQRVPAGVYFYKLNADGRTLSDRVLLLR